MPATLRTLVSGIGLSVAIIIAVVIPSGYFLIHYFGKANLIQFKAELIAGSVAKYVHRNDEPWQYQRAGLADLAEVIDRGGRARVHKRVVDADGQVLFNDGPKPGLPKLAREAEIVIAGNPVARVEIETSLWRLIGETALVSLLSALLGFAAVFALRVLPLRVLDRTLGQLASANRAIKDSNDLLRLQNEALVANDIKLQTSNRHFDAALNNMIQGLCLFDTEGRVVVCNQRYLDMYGLSPDIVKPGCSLERLMEHRKETGTFLGDPVRYAEEMHRAMTAGETVNTVIQIADGRMIALVSRPTPGGGWVATHEDITARRKAEARSDFLARHDALTSLPNRLHFREELEKTLAGLQTGEVVGVLSFDLRRFKLVNETLGHQAGDRLLQLAAERLQDCIREEDATVCRLGADEFAILQRQAEQPQGATALALRVGETLARPFDINGHQVNIGVTTGISIADSDDKDADRLLKNADLALYRAKAEGRGTFRFFEPEMDARMKARHQLELDMRKGLSNGEFELYYQPVLTLETQTLSGFEALVRWNHPERGLVLPGEFIPLAEEVGLIAPLGEWVLREACREAKAWPDDLCVAVNLSPEQFKSHNLEQVAFSALAHSGLAPHRLELEITESILLADEESTLATLHKLRDFGVRIAMDDFGTGYSSLAYLRSFPFDKIKIDKSFISDMLTSEDCLAIVRAVSGLGASLGIAITAEGVETPGQLDRLKKEGCTQVQGYLFSPPRPAKDLPGLIARMGGDTSRCVA